MKQDKIIIIVLCLFVATACYVPAYSSDVRIDGDRVVITQDDGTTIDTDNLPTGKQVHEGDDVQVHEGGVSIGTVTNNGTEQQGTHRSTILDNVTIINNGETTVYHRGKQKQKDPEK